MPPVLQLRGIVKRYPGEKGVSRHARSPGVLANDHVDLEVAEGEIRALVGENGAGKSTLMSVLFGLIQPDEGEIRIKGRPVTFGSPQEAMRAGLGMVHQSFMLFPSLSVADNVVYGAEPTRAGMVDRAQAVERVADLASRHGLAVDPRAKVETLPVGVCQRVEILKALYREADILILDEPTAVLTPQERDGLFRVLKSLAADGKTIVFITHKLAEVMSVSDSATVMRDGRVTAVVRTADTSPAEIARFMIGRDVLLNVEKHPVEAGQAVLEVRDLRVANEEGRAVVDGVSLEVHTGEVVGLAGVAGNGQTELVEALVGLRPIAAGSVMLAGRDVTNASVAVRRETGLAYIPEDRSAVGTAVDADLQANLAMGFHRRAPLSRRGLLRFAAFREHARRLMERYGIRARGPGVRAGALSGGNLQKVVVAREFAHDAALLIAEQPTRGVDVGAIEFVHATLLGYRDAGHAILLVSAELNEILSLADRVLVMFEGRLVGEVPAGEATEAGLGLLMTGSANPAAPV